MTSRLFSRRVLLALGTALLIPLTNCSCRVTAQSVAKTQHSQNYERLEIIYRAHSAAGPLFTANHEVPTSRSGIIQTSAQIVEPAPFENISWSKAELRIESPHPDGRKDVAKVTLRFKPVDCCHECERRSWRQKFEEQVGVRKSRNDDIKARWFYTASPVCQGETYAEMELAREELDRILADLDSHGYFSEHSRSADSESQLEVRLNRRWTSKRWSFEPQLDALTTRVYEQGSMKRSLAER
ncbi:MAG: hypothetical protein WCJ09_25665 [Planctomycetota bacterium]